MPEQFPTAAAESRGYDIKPNAYFAGERADMLGIIDEAASGDILEIGCGRGATGRLALALGKTDHFVGIELMADAASEAKKWLSHVEVGNAETIDLVALGGPFGAILCSEVLEHLNDPWAMVEKLTTVLKPGGLLIASSPNIANKNLIMSLIHGDFNYTEFGIMDRTHLRWFTAKTYRRLFEDAGLKVEFCGPVSPLRWKAKLFSKLTFGKYDHLFWQQVMVAARKG